MRFSEIITEDYYLSEFIEDDADIEADAALVDTLREIQFSSNHAQVPKISAEALINLVRTKPGAEAFTMDTLKKAKQYNDAVKNIVADIKEDGDGVLKVFINPVEPNEETPEIGADGEAVKTAPEKTVSAMAKSALAKRS